MNEQASDLTPEQLKKLIYDEDYKRRRAEAEQKAIDDLINNQVSNSFNEIVQCMRCGKQKPHDNFPMCPACTQIVSKTLEQEDKEFEKLEHFAGVNHVKDKEKNNG